MKDVFFLRLAIGAPDSQTSDVKHAWEVIRKAADAVLTSHKAWWSQDTSLYVFIIIILYIYFVDARVTLL